MHEPLLTVLTRDIEGNREWERALAEKGIATYSLPCIEIQYLPLYQERIDIYKHVSQYTWVVLTSSNGVRAFVRDLQELSLTTTALPSVAIVGEKTATYALQQSLTVSFIPSHATSEALGRELPLDTCSNILLLQGARADTSLATLLEARGAQVTRLNLYETRLVTTPDEALEGLLREAKVGFIMFASPSAVEAFCTRLTPTSLALAKKLPASAIGDTTKKALESMGWSEITSS